MAFRWTSTWEQRLTSSSPYCPHCIDYAPTYQTLYEYYFTSHPDSTAETSFIEYYDFRFGMINCVAYYDLCVNNGVQTYPMTTLFEDGVAIENVRGVKDMEEVSQTVEAALEKQKPGSRPEPLELPKAGDKEFPKGAGEQAEELKKADVETGDTDKDKLNLKDGELPAQKAAGKDSTKSSAKDSKKTSGKGTAKEDETGKSEKAEDWTTDNDWKSETAAETFNKKEPKKPTVPPNPNGVTISLTAESFQHMVTMSQDPWFIKFYAPWCPHCQAMGPTWDQLAKNMQGKLNVGEVNCDKESRLCKDVNARSYPTILFFKGGERAEYRGLRGLGDFVEYADKAIDLAGGVPDVTAAEFEALEEKEEVIFTYFYDHATTSEDFTALERIPLSLIGHAKLVKTNDPALFDRFKITTWPRLIVSREGRPTYYTPLTPNEMRNVHGVLDWMRSVWLPLVPELTASNARQIMDGKVVVLGVLNRQDADGFSSALKEMKSAANEWMDRQIQEFQLERKKLRDAKQMRIEEAQDRDDERALRAAKGIRIDMNESGRKEVGFAWADGVFWQRWIKTTYGIDVADGERVIINDQDVSFLKPPFSTPDADIYRPTSTMIKPSRATTSWSPAPPSPSPSTRSSTAPTPSSPSSPPRSSLNFSSTCATLLSAIRTWLSAPLS